MNGSGYLAFLRKEALEIRRTWRIWVLPGLLLFFGFTSPVLARIAPNLVKSLTADQPGTIIQLPEPVPLDAYVQMAKMSGMVRPASTPFQRTERDPATTGFTIALS